jgi:hypothetical protein
MILQSHKKTTLQRILLYKIYFSLNSLYFICKVIYDDQDGNLQLPYMEDTQKINDKILRIR